MLKLHREQGDPPPLHLLFPGEGPGVVGALEALGIIIVVLVSTLSLVAIQQLNAPLASPAILQNEIQTHQMTASVSMLASR